MAIFVQGECCGIVEHVFLERLDIIAGFDAVHSKSVAKIMDAEMVQASLFQDFLEFFPDSWLNVMVPVRMSENQSGEISFMNTSLIAIRTLDKPVIVKSKPGEGVLGDTTEYQYERIQMDGFTLEECLTFFQHE